MMIKVETRVTLSDVTHFPTQDPGRIVFRALVNINGNPAFVASNAGQRGESNFYEWVKDWRGFNPIARAEDWAKERGHSLDYEINRLVLTHNARDRLNEILKTNLVLKDGNSLVTLNATPNDTAGRMTALALHKGAVVLNDIPFEKALDLYVGL